MSAWLQRVGTATPRHEAHAALCAHARALLGSERDRQLLDRIVEHSGIAHRYSVLEPAPPGHVALDASGFYATGAFPGLAARLALHQEAGLGLALHAVQALAGGDELPAELARVTHLVVVSSTGLGAPGLDVRLIDALGLPADVHRLVVAPVGPAALLPALRCASDTVCCDHQAQVLVVDVELQTLHLHEDGSFDALLPFVLHGDAAAAALIGADPWGAELVDFRARLLAEGRELAALAIGERGIEQHTSALVAGRIAEALIDERERLDAASLLRGAAHAAPAWWAVHAEAAVLDAVQAALALPPEALADSRAVLRAVGHIGSAGVLFVLRRLLGTTPPGATGVALAFGPGLSAEALHLHVAGLS